MPTRSFKRSGPSRAVKPKFTIICEGKATEVGYFNEIRKDLRLTSVDIEVCHPGATDPLSLVEEALTRRRDRETNKQWTTTDQVWAVYDGDEHRTDTIKQQRWQEALQKAGGILTDTPTKVHLAISNPSFELWYLLHFQEQNAYLHRDDAFHRVKHHLPIYEKNQIVWIPLKEKLEDACTRAETLKKRAGVDGRDRHPNPYTCVHLLVRNLHALRDGEINRP